MSLDVTLTGKLKDVDCKCECGHRHTRQEAEYYFSQNITHNLGKMADDAGIYGIVWRPEQNGIETAAQLVEPLSAGIALLKSDKARFEAFNAPNGWGLYENFVPWLERYLEACKGCPDATVSVSC